MTPRTLFQIIIKIFGLFFVLAFINSIPQLMTTIGYYINPSTGSVDDFWLFSLGILIGLGINVFFIYLFLFNSNVLVDKLKLDQWFDDDVFNFKIPKSFVLYTAILVIAGIVLVEEIPNLVLDVYLFIQSTPSTYGENEFNFTSTILSVAKIVLVLLMVGERKFIAKLIDKDVEEDDDAASENKEDQIQ